MDYSRPPLADALAAAYVAGTLRGRARQRFEALLPAHPALRDAVTQWRDRLMPLTASIEPVAPSAEVWSRIQARTGDPSAAAATSKKAGESPMASVSSWWQRVSVWRGLSALATTAAVLLAVALVTPPPAQPPIVVVLNATPDAGAITADAGGVVPASFIAGISSDGRAVVTQPLTQVNLAAGRALELWALPGTGAPTSLGLISAQDASLVRGNRLPAGTSALAVSLEPQGGSPTGAPTGPVLYVGKLTI